jgi:hypothetical protein
VINPAGALTAADSIERAPLAATASLGTVADGVHFGGSAPGGIRAAVLNRGLTAGFGGLVVVGSAGILAAVVLLVRGRGRRPAPINKIEDHVAERVAEPGRISAESPSADIE